MTSDQKFKIGPIGCGDVAGYKSFPGMYQEMVSALATGESEFLPSAAQKQRDAGISSPASNAVIAARA